MRRRISILLALCVLVSCGPKQTAEQKYPVPFPKTEVPGMYTDREDILGYLLENYWKGYFALNGPTDSTMIGGVLKSEVEQALSNYIGFLGSVDLATAQKYSRGLFDKISAAHLNDSTPHYYPMLTELVSRYMYDPNSPMRDEDIYLPFARALSESPLTPEDMRPAFATEARFCAMNPRGSVAPDFRVRTIRGTEFTLHSVKAEYTMLFFSNPGCTACKEIIDAVMGREYVPGMLEDGTLAVVNVYIDEDLKAWREYEHNYPASWKTGYDPAYIIRGDVLYNVRAIPSLYLLDSEKRVMMKDAPLERVLNFFDNL